MPPDPYWVQRHAGGWDGRVRTFACQSQSLVPYHLATSHYITCPCLLYPCSSQNKVAALPCFSHALAFILPEAGGGHMVKTCFLSFTKQGGCFALFWKRSFALA